MPIHRQLIPHSYLCSTSSTSHNGTFALVEVVSLTSPRKLFQPLSNNKYMGAT